MTQRSQLGTKEMILLMKLAGWEYVKETRDEYAFVWNSKTGKTYHACWDNSDNSCRSNRTNVCEIFNAFLEGEL